jgi:hypothetical protein
MMGYEGNEDVRAEMGLTDTNKIVKKHSRTFPKVSGLAAWSENCKWSSLPLGAVVSVFCESV